MIRYKCESNQEWLWLGKKLDDLGFLWGGCIKNATFYLNNYMDFPVIVEIYTFDTPPIDKGMYWTRINAHLIKEKCNSEEQLIVDITADKLTQC